MECARRGRAVLPLALAATALWAVPAFVGGGAPGGLRGAAAPVARAEGALGPHGAPGLGEGPEGAGSVDPARLGAAALSILAALVVSFAPAGEAQAAKSGGRIGGSAQAARSKPPPGRTSTNVINKTTVVERNTTVVVPPPPVVAPVAPMGMGFGMAPVVVAPPPTLGEIVVGAAVSSAIHSAVAPHHYGPSVNDRILENQQRQDERQMDRQANQIEDLQRELQQLKAQK